jgi:ribose transport system substrate-binding protein
MKTEMPRLLACAALCAALLSGCAPREESAPPAPPGSASAPASTAAGSKLVGVALSSRNHNFFLGMEQGVTEELQAQGLQAEVVVAEDSASTQQQQVDQLVRKGVGAIIMVPVDAQQAATPIQAANQAGVPVFCIDRRVTTSGVKVTATIETSNVAMGEMAAGHALKLLCARHGLNPQAPADVKRLKSTVVHLWGLEAASSAQDRAAGFDKVFNTARTPAVKVIKAVGNFNAKTAQEVMAPILTANPEIELVFCHNDDNAIGALNAILDLKKERGAPGDPKRILIVGMDGNKAAIEEIRKGNIEATVSQEPILMGRETVRQVAKVLSGSQPDQEYLAIPHHLVTQKEAMERKGQLWSDQLRDAKG